jgi:hypothetical protein
LYDKTATLPPKGSLREALFLTVWLRRQEAEVFKTRIFAQGFVDIDEDGAKGTAEVFKRYVASALPFLEKSQTATDKQMKEAMQREVKKGVIKFSAPTSNPLVQRAKSMRLPDEFRQKMLNRTGKRIVEV